MSEEHTEEGEMGDQTSFYYDQENDQWRVVFRGDVRDMRDMEEFFLAFRPPAEVPHNVEIAVYSASEDSVCSAFPKVWEEHGLPLINKPIILWHTKESPVEFLKCCSFPHIKAIEQEALIPLLQEPHQIGSLETWVERLEPLELLINAVRAGSVLRSLVYLDNRNAMDPVRTENAIRNVFALEGRIQVLTGNASAQLHAIYRRVVRDVVMERGHMLELFFEAHRPLQTAPRVSYPGPRPLPPQREGAAAPTRRAVRVPPRQIRRPIETGAVLGLYERAMKNWQAHRKEYCRAIAASSLLQHGYVRRLHGAPLKLAQEGLAVLRFFRWPESEHAAESARLAMRAQDERRLREEEAARERVDEEEN